MASSTSSPNRSRLTLANIPQLYTSPAERAVLTSLQHVLDFVSGHDYKRVEPYVLPNGGTARLRPGEQIMYGTIGELIKAIADMSGEPGEWEEYMFDPVVMVTPLAASGVPKEGDKGEDTRPAGLAVVWTPCHIRKGGGLVSEAVNCISLHLIGGTWKVSGISDTATLNLQAAAAAGGQAAEEAVNT